jgi:hypothetical protein
MFTLSLINPASLIITVVTGFGVLVHDTKIDKATVTALSAPAIVAVGYATASYAAHEMRITADPHVHVETTTERLRNMVAEQPRLQTRLTDDKKYLNTKKAFLGNTSDDNMLVFVPA